MIEEIWKDIPDYDGVYQVSNLGNVRSFKNNRHGLTNKPKLLKRGLSSNGYLTVNLWRNKVKKAFCVHVLVAMAFLNHTPNGYKIVIDHINNDKLDNKVSNLQLTTNRHNSSKDRKGKSQYTGVGWNKALNKWQSRIVINGKLKHIGYFTCELQASKAYQQQLNKITT